MLTDVWQGLDQFFVPGEELIAVESAADVLDALNLPEERRREIGRAARARVLREHTSAHRVGDLERVFASAH
jgi:spore maturation protein CgeB